MTHRGWDEFAIFFFKKGFDLTKHAIPCQASSNFCAWEGTCLRAALVVICGVASPAWLFSWELSPLSTWLPREPLFLYNPTLSHNWSQVWLPVWRWVNKTLFHHFFLFELRSHSLKKIVFLLIYLFLVALGLCCCTKVFLCGEQGLLSSCGARASHCHGFSRGAQVLGTQASVSAACGLSNCGSQALEWGLSSCGTWA